LRAAATPDRTAHLERYRYGDARCTRQLAPGSCSTSTGGPVEFAWWSRSGWSWRPWCCGTGSPSLPNLRQSVQRSVCLVPVDPHHV